MSLLWKCMCASLAILGVIALAACSAASTSSANTSGPNISVTAPVTGATPSATPSADYVTALNDNRIAFADLANANLPRQAIITLAGVKADCTLINNAYRYGQLYANSPFRKLVAAGKALFASLSDLRAYGCSHPILSSKLHPTPVNLSP